MHTFRKQKFLLAFFIVELVLFCGPVYFGQAQTTTVDSTAIIITPVESASSTPALQPTLPLTDTTLVTNSNEAANTVSSTTLPNSTETVLIPKTAPKNGDPINPVVEDILSEISTPDTDTESATTNASPAPIKKSNPQAPARLSENKNATLNKQDNVATTSDNSSTTTPVAGLIINDGLHGDANQFSAANYYFPLDRLSTEATYGLAGIAIVIGLAGAYLIISSERPVRDEEELWIPIGSEPRLRPQRSNY